MQRRQQDIYNLVYTRGEVGATADEIEASEGLSHGKVSSPLSTLHRLGTLAKLKERRNGFGIYVIPKWVHGREEVKWNPNKATIVRAHNLVDVARSVEVARMPDQDYTSLLERVVDNWIESARKAGHRMGAHASAKCLPCASYELRSRRV